MKHYKSERLKKLESELADLEQWLKLGLVPKRDIDKHKEEILSLTAKIEEEQERLQFLKESGEAEEYIAPKRGPTRAGYTEMPTLPDVEVGESQSGNYQETSYGIDTEHGEFESSQTETGGDEEEDQTFNEDEESYFSERNRWRRGRNIIDPDADEW
jgi:poly-D-alanine transfer protein DltD